MSLSTWDGPFKKSLKGIYISMYQRCYDAKSIGFKWYGAKGVKICDEWRKSRPAFYDWATQQGYKPGDSIERVDPFGDYSPRNCKFIPRNQQQLNTRRTRRIKFNGENLTLREWSEKTGLPLMTIITRFRRGWDSKAILKTPRREYPC